MLFSNHLTRKFSWINYFQLAVIVLSDNCHKSFKVHVYIIDRFVSVHFHVITKFRLLSEHTAEKVYFL